MSIKVADAKALLDSCEREELVDRAFGDTEVFWMRGEVEIASGYFGSDCAEVAGDGWLFTGADALALRDAGNLTKVDRNDSGS